MNGQQIKRILTYLRLPYPTAGKSFSLDEFSHFLIPVLQWPDAAAAEATEQDLWLLFRAEDREGGADVGSAEDDRPNPVRPTARRSVIPATRTTRS